MNTNEANYGIRYGAVYFIPRNKRYGFSVIDGSQQGIKQMTVVGLTRSEAEQAASEWNDAETTHLHNMGNWFDRWQMQAAIKECPPPSRRHPF